MQYLSEACSLKLASECQGLPRLVSLEVSLVLQTRLRRGDPVTHRKLLANFQLQIHILGEDIMIRGLHRLCRLCNRPNTMCTKKMSFAQGAGATKVGHGTQKLSQRLRLCNFKHYFRTRTTFLSQNQSFPQYCTIFSFKKVDLL